MEMSDLDNLLSTVQAPQSDPQQLTGADLLKVVVEHSEAPRDELLALCGYFTTKEDGKRSYRYTEFYQALIAAQGINLKPPSKGGGRSLPFKVTCQKNNQVLLGSAYLRNGGYKVGDKFKVEVLQGSIKLTPVRK